LTQPPLGRRAAIAAIKSVAYHPLEWVLLFGGEPCLEMDLMLAVARGIRPLVRATLIVFTNAYWAEDEMAAIEVLKPLRDSGVDCLNLSLDDYHTPFVPAGRVLNAAKVALSLGLEATVDGRLPASPAETKAAEHTLSLLDWIQRETGVATTSGPIRPLGRASDLPDALPDRLDSCVLPTYLGEGPSNPTGVEIHPGGEVCLCAGICLGNIHERPLNEIYYEYRSDRHPVLSALYRSGPRALLDQAISLGYLPSDVASAPMSRCRACYTARKALLTEFKSELRPVHCYGVS